MMSRVKHGIIAGSIATAVIAVVEAINVLFLKMFLPFPEILARMLGMAGNQVAGWGIHLAIGILVLGPIFAYLYSRLPTNTPETRGIVFAVGCWVAIMLVITMGGNSRTMAGSEGFGSIAFMLVTHMIYGGVMGNVYARLLAREKRAHSIVGGAPAH